MFRVKFLCEILDEWRVNCMQIFLGTIFFRIFNLDKFLLIFNPITERDVN